MTDTPTPGAAPAAPAVPTAPKVGRGPDTRGTITIGLFLLTVLIFALLAWRPELKDNNLFVVLSTAIISGAGMNAMNYYFGDSKRAVDADKAP